MNTETLCVIIEKIMEEKSMKKKEYKDRLIELLNEGIEELTT
ncbi:hypothetical protein [Paenibacillus polymyxa]|nr:hypothetical protein [Paenibacillus polymyxa]AUS27802.1 hypothetical protein C1A50_3638 [Paenibacillus polymyxa]WOZ37093.1 hypothetical protein RQP19_17190 [Paenibacillus polymyxa]